MKKQRGFAELEAIISEIKILAIKYQDITGKPLGITGEVGEFEAAKLLGLELVKPRTAGYDALRRVGKTIKKIQIKSRRVFPSTKLGGRLGSIYLNHDWDKVLLVLLDTEFEPFKIYEADRCKVEEALTAPGSFSRNVRGALGIRMFQSISELIWMRSE